TRDVARTDPVPQRSVRCRVDARNLVEECVDLPRVVTAEREAVILVGAADLAAVAFEELRRRFLLGSEIEIAEIAAIADILVALEEIVRRIARRPRSAGLDGATHLPPACGAGARFRWERRPAVEDAVRAALRLLIRIERDAPAARKTELRRA